MSYLVRTLRPSGFRALSFSSGALEIVWDWIARRRHQESFQRGNGRRWIEKDDEPAVRMSPARWRNQ